MYDLTDSPFYRHKMSDWIPVFLMPNLRVAHEIVSEEMAIVPCTDERLKPYESSHPQFKQFVQKFTDPFGARVSPGVLLLRSDAPGTFKSIEAVSSLRDLLALSVIPLQRARGIVHDGSHHIQYSDYFDFYPWVYHEGTSTSFAIRPPNSHCMRFASCAARPLRFCQRSTSTIWTWTSRFLILCCNGGEFGTARSGQNGQTAHYFGLLTWRRQRRRCPLALTSRHSLLVETSDFG
jgi:hypothetical protein